MTKKTVFAAWASVLALGAQAAGAEAAGNGKDLAGLLVKIEQSRLDAYGRHDCAALERDLAPDYVHTNLYGSRTDKQQEIEEFCRSGRFALARGSVANPVVHRYGDVAILRADVSWNGASYTPASRAAVDLSGVYSITRVYVLTHGHWLIVASHASRQPPK